MNLQEFIKFRDKCPICHGSLITEFHSNRKQAIRYEDNRVTFTLTLDSVLKRSKPYKASYSFGLADNSVRIEFYTKEGKHFYTESPKFLRDRFLELHNNLRRVNFRFIRECVNRECMRYIYYSNLFDMDLRRASFQSLDVRTETMALSHPLQVGFRNYLLSNNLVQKKTNLLFWKSPSDVANISNIIPPNNSTNLQLPLIPFVSVEETTKRLNNLIVFS
jgi:hypothetical protein